MKECLLPAGCWVVTMESASGCQKKKIPCLRTPAWFHFTTCFVEQSTQKRFIDKRNSWFNLPFRRRFVENLHVSVAERVRESPPRSTGLSPMQKNNIKVVSMSYYVRFALPPISCHGRRERRPRTRMWALGAVCLMSLLMRAALIARSWGTSWKGWALHLVQMVRGSGIWSMAFSFAENDNMSCFIFKASLRQDPRCTTSSQVQFRPVCRAPGLHDVAHACWDESFNNPRVI